MTWIKSCGITNMEDARVAVDAAADAVGFVFYEKSPRNVDAERVRDIVAKLPPQIEKVGVFVNASIETVLKIADQADISGVQLHGDEDLAFAEAFHARCNRRCQIYRAVPMNSWLSSWAGAEG